MVTENEVTEVSEVSKVSNGAEELISLKNPLFMDVRIKGTADLIFHRWNCEEVDEKNNAVKGSDIKKTDVLENYVWRNEHNELCLPGEYLRQSIINAAKFRQDPRSKRKSAMDLYKAGVVCLTELSSLKVKTWDYEDRRRVTIQGKSSAITRTRPAIKKDWEAAFRFMVLTPEYINRSIFHEVLVDAGRLVGVGDFRPTYGRFQVIGCKEALND